MLARYTRSTLAGVMLVPTEPPAPLRVLAWPDPHYVPGCLVYNWDCCLHDASDWPVVQQSAIALAKGVFGKRLGRAMLFRTRRWFFIPQKSSGFGFVSACGPGD
jgi:hypothetical protein